MDYQGHENKKSDDYAAQAKAAWGGTKEYAEYADKSKNRTESEKKRLADELMSVFAGFGAMRGKALNSDEVKAQVQKLQSCITKHYYTCSKEILASLGQMYTEDEAFRQNIDRAGGEGTAAFVRLAIREYCNA